MDQDRDATESGEVSPEDLQRLQDAHPHDPEHGVDSTASLNKPNDPSLNREMPVAKGVSSD